MSLLKNQLQPSEKAPIPAPERKTDLSQARSTLSTDPTASTNPVYHIPPTPAKTYFPCLTRAIGGLFEGGVSILRKTLEGAEEGKDGRRLLRVGFDMAVVC